MAQKIVSSIKAAENEAREIIENQKRQNQADLEEAGKSAREKTKSVNAAKQKSIADAKSRADEDAKANIETLREEYDQKIAKLSKVAGGNLSESVKFIISKI